MVIDVSGMSPEDVTPIVEVLEDSAGRYVFISTVSVYADHSVPQVEGQPVIPLSDGLSPVRLMEPGRPPPKPPSSGASATGEL